MIDTHCHLLWRIDDGPRSSLEAMELARALVGHGVRIALCTPHYSQRFPTRMDVARDRFTELRRDLTALDVPLDVALAAEVSHRLALSVPTSELRERAFGDFVLVELESGAPADAPMRVAARLADAGLTAVFAHPERCRAISRDTTALDDARSGGALTQVVASSLAGRWGPRVVDAAWELLDGGRIDLLGSDAHGPRGSVLRLTEVIRRVAHRYGEQTVAALIERVPARLLSIELAPS
jgi:protein-tyrosine phosphatase